MKKEETFKFKEIEKMPVFHELPEVIEEDLRGNKEIKRLQGTAHLLDEGLLRFTLRAKKVKGSYKIELIAYSISMIGKFFRFRSLIVDDITEYLNCFYPTIPLPSASVDNPRCCLFDCNKDKDLVVVLMLRGYTEKYLDKILKNTIYLGERIYEI